MSAPLPRIQEESVYLPTGSLSDDNSGKSTKVGGERYGANKHVLHVSEGHPINRKTGVREGGGPFHVTHSEIFIDPGYVVGARSTANPALSYSGAVIPGLFGILNSEIANLHYNGNLSKSIPDMDADGATAISQCAPTNPTANLGTTLAESFREGVPSLPGIQSWENRTRYLKSLGSEYLNYQFGWAPLQSEVHSVVNAARHHRDIMQNYKNGEGTNVHREFDFSNENQIWREDHGDVALTGNQAPNHFFRSFAKSEVVVERRVRKYFKGCFTYGGPSKVDSYGRALQFGKEADQVYGISLTPSVLWEFAPWSWAVDWFSNTGDVINNVTNFALAGLVMRYGYMMQEVSHTVYNVWDDVKTVVGDYNHATEQLSNERTIYQGGGGRFGFKSVEKSRSPANPFGFGVGWEDLSPTQLAITAAIGITRSL